MPDPYIANGYPFLAHGVGLCDEWPYCHTVENLERWGEEVVLEDGMTICVESYIGAEGGDEGVKLEQQFLSPRAAWNCCQPSPSKRRFWGERSDLDTPGEIPGRGATLTGI